MGQIMQPRHSPSSNPSAAAAATAAAAAAALYGGEAAAIHAANLQVSLETIIFV